MKILRSFSVIFLIIILASGCSEDNPINGQEPEPTPVPSPIPTPTPTPEPIIIGQSISGTITVHNKRLVLGMGDNVTVELHKKGKKVQSTISDKAGKYSLTNIPEGVYTIVMSKKGYYNQPIRKIYIDGYSYTIKKDVSLTADLKLYKKSTASIQEIRWRQGSIAKGDDSNGVVLDVKFKNLNMSEIDDYVYIYFFAGYNDQISKENCQEKIDKANGDGWTPGYAKAWIPKKAIVNNELNGYWESRVCGWIGGTLKQAKRPTHVAVYMTNCLLGAVDGLFGDEYATVGDDYSGISDTRFLKKN